MNRTEITATVLVLCLVLAGSIAVFAGTVPLELEPVMKSIDVAGTALRASADQFEAEREKIGQLFHQAMDLKDVKNRTKLFEQYFDTNKQRIAQMKDRAKEAETLSKDVVCEVTEAIALTKNKQTLDFLRQGLADLHRTEEDLRTMQCLLDQFVLVVKGMFLTGPGQGGLRFKVYIPIPTTTTNGHR